MEIIVVLDFGSQYNQLIARRIRDFGVYSELHPNDLTLAEIKKLGDVKGIILSGGPNSVYDQNSFKCDVEIFNGEIPVLGICYGMQLIHYSLGGNVASCKLKEYGRAGIKTTTSPLFKDLPEKQIVWASHGDQVDILAPGFEKIASSDTCLFAASHNLDKNIYTVQWHPEVRDSEFGIKMLENFAFEICGCQKTWSMDKFAESEIDKIREKVGNQKVVLGLSGGVDSSVVAMLVHKAIGNNLYCMFIDHGLLRQNEADEVQKMFKDNFKMNFFRIDASAKFLNALKGIIDPEAKRKIIGKLFVETFEKEMANLVKDEDIKWLAQGTLYTDIIESGTKTAQTIKSHHNVGGLPEDMKFNLIEPLNTLFKDEVRALGLKLGLSKEMVNRQPFPGPGLGIRIIGEITLDKIRIVQESDFILREEIKKAGLDQDIWQYFTVCLNSKSVGVMGDQRTYDYAVCIRAIKSIDGMTGDFYHIPYDVLGFIANRIVNEVKGCNRVVYDITSKPPGTIEWE